MNRSNDCFDECKDCMYKDHSNDLMCCAVSKLGLVDKYKYCNWFQKEEQK